MRIADQALCIAKHRGRNRVARADKLSVTGPANYDRGHEIVRMRISR
jgi:hypothetical protein